MNQDEGFNINNDDYEDIKIKHRDLKLIVIVCLLSALIIDIMYNFNINEYIKVFVIPFGMMISSYIYIIKKMKLEINKKAYILLIPIILILISIIFLEIDESNMILNFLVLPTLISIFLFSLINKNYTISKLFLKWAFKLFPRGILGNLQYIKKLLNSINNDKVKFSLNILFGCLIGLPIAILLLYLLANADKYFSNFVSSIFNFLTSIFNINFLRTDLFIIIFSFIIIFTIFINLFKNKDTKINLPTYKKTNHSIISTVLVIINIVFVLFLISEISKVTTNFLQLPIEYTYAEYAREGFFQLLTVTTINFSIILYYLYCTDAVEKSKFIKNMLLVLITFSIILILNSYYRMFLYVDEYGLTVLRLQVIMFLTMELALFIVIIKKIINALKHRDAILFMIIIISSYILNIYLCTNIFINFLNNL